MLSYFYNYSYLGKPTFILCSILAGCSGSQDLDSIIRFGFIGIVLFLYSNILLYLFLQIPFFSNLLLKSIGYQLFDKYVGFNTASKILAQAGMVGKRGF